MRQSIPKNAEIMSWDPENMEAYWQQCRQFDTRALFNVRRSQQDSDKAFNLMLKRFAQQDNKR